MSKGRTHSDQNHRNHTPICSYPPKSNPNRKSCAKEGVSQPPKPHGQTIHAPHTLTNEPKPAKSLVVSKRGTHSGRNQRNHTPSAHKRVKLTRIASRERKGVSIEVENDENMHPFAHRRAKSNEIATREQEAAQTGQPETATLSGKSNPNGVATVTKVGNPRRNLSRADWTKPKSAQNS